MKIYNENYQKKKQTRILLVILAVVILGVGGLVILKKSTETRKAPGRYKIRSARNVDKSRSTTRRSRRKTSVLSLSQVKDRIDPFLVHIQARDKNHKRLSDGTGVVIGIKGETVNLACPAHIFKNAEYADIITVSGKFSVKNFIPSNFSQEIAIISVEDQGIGKVLGHKEMLSKKVPERGKEIFVARQMDGSQTVVANGVVTDKTVMMESGKRFGFTSVITDKYNGCPVLDGWGKVMGFNIPGKLGGEEVNFILPLDQVAKQQKIQVAKTKIKRPQEGPKKEDPYQKGLRLYAQTQYYQAIDSFERALAVDDKNPEIYYYIGMSRLKNYQSQPDVLKQKQVKKTTTEYYRYSYYSDYTYKRKRTKKVTVMDKKEINLAIQYLEMATVMKSDFYKAWKELGKVQLQEGEPKSAMKALEQAVKLSPESDTLYLLGAAYMAENKYQQARKVLVKSIKKDPTLPEANILLLQVSIQLNQWKPGLRYANKALSIGVEHPEIRFLRGILYVGNGQLANAKSEKEYLETKHPKWSSLISQQIDKYRKTKKPPKLNMGY